MSVTRPTLRPAAGLDCLAVAVVVAMAMIATRASSIAARRLLVFSGTPPRTWTGRMLRDVRMPRIVSAAPAGTRDRSQGHRLPRLCRPAPGVQESPLPDAATARRRHPMRRPLLAALACAITLSALATGAANGSGRRPQAGHDHVLERVHDPRAARLPAGLRRLPQEVPVDHGQGHGRHHGRQDHRRHQRRQRARRAALLLAQQHGQVLLDSGAWQNLNDRIAKDKFDLSQSSRRSRSRTRATRGCSARCPPSPTPTACT